MLAVDVEGNSRRARMLAAGEGTPRGSKGKARVQGARGWAAGRLQGSEGGGNNAATRRWQPIPAGCHLNQQQPSTSSSQDAALAPPSPPPWQTRECPWPASSSRGTACCTACCAACRAAHAPLPPTCCAACAPPPHLHARRHVDARGQGLHAAAGLPQRVYRLRLRVLVVGVAHVQALPAARGWRRQGNQGSISVIINQCAVQARRACCAC